MLAKYPTNAIAETERLGARFWLELLGNGQDKKVRMEVVGSVQLRVASFVNWLTSAEIKGTLKVDWQRMRSIIPLL